jgi:hypothetical protein
LPAAQLNLSHGQLRLNQTRLVLLLRLAVWLQHQLMLAGLLAGLLPLLLWGQQAAGCAAFLSQLQGQPSCQICCCF